MTRDELSGWLKGLGLPAPTRPWPDSEHRFADERRYHFEIPSVEGPVVLRAVLEEADALAALEREHHVEVCLFLGPRGAWDAGGQALATEAAAGVARGAEAIEACVAEARRACEHGIRSILVGDIGALDVLAGLREQGLLPREL